MRFPDPVAMAIWASVGVLLGPVIASLSVKVPKGRAEIGPDSLIGAGASVRRVAVSALAAAVVLASLAVPQLVRGGVPLIAVAGIVLTQIDVAHHRLPDLVVLPAAAIFGVLTAIHTPSRIVATLLTGAAFFAVFFALALINPRGLGFGDVKLAGLIGMVVGRLDASLSVVWLVATCLVSLGWIGVLLVTRRATLKSAVAFGPPMLGGLWATLLVTALYS